MIGVLDITVDGVGGCPDTLGSGNAIERGQTIQQSGVVSPYEDGVVPSAGAHDDPFCLRPFLSRLWLVEAVLYLSQVSGTDGQVGGIDGDSLTPAALYSLVRQPTARMIKRVGGTLLVFQRVTPDIILPPGIFLPGTGIGRNLADDGDQQAGYESEQTVNTHCDCKGTKFF